MRSDADLQSLSSPVRALVVALVALVGGCSEAGDTSLRVVRNHVVSDAAPSADSAEVAEDVTEVPDTMELIDTASTPEVDVVEPPDAIDARDATDPIDTSEPIDTSAPETVPDTGGPETVADIVTSEEVTPAACPADMRELTGSAAACIDRWEAPNREGEPPLVMYTFNEAEAWCGARDKRLCFDDEWLLACAGPAGAAGLKYPYGNAREPGRCNDDRVWRQYTQGLLNGWPAAASSPSVESLEGLMQAVRDRGATASSAADHVMSLYQGTAAGERPRCVGESEVEDLVGNVEEWVRRRDGGDGAQFSGALVGRYWAESRTCQSHVTVHGNTFRFYEIGFRCCRDIDGP